MPATTMTAVMTVMTWQRWQWWQDDSEIDDNNDDSEDDEGGEVTTAMCWDYGRFFFGPMTIRVLYAVAWTREVFYPKLNSLDLVCFLIFSSSMKASTKWRLVGSLNTVAITPLPLPSLSSSLSPSLSPPLSFLLLPLRLSSQRQWGRQWGRRWGCFIR